MVSRLKKTKKVEERKKMVPSVKSTAPCAMKMDSFLTPPDVDTAEKMQKFCIQEMKKDGMIGFFAWLATRSIPNLERWKQ